MLHYNFIFFTLIISFALSQQSQVTHTQVHFNGNIKSITNHVKHGKGIQKWSREEYDKYGNKHGAWIGWDENGLMSYETVWEFGIYRQYREWYRDGSKKLVRKYDDEGNLTDMKKWDKKGNEIIETLSLYGQ
jgi:antitoxin component YwqK of YwqJK toxin-antitoxin module|tara:strand:- start:3006 stop:3401 length:396 start_codon:yes stop_codon:yes gene_type:complete